MRIRDDRGSYTIEALFIFPLLLVFFVLTFWFGTLMYTWSSINYTAMQYALDIAKAGEDKQEFRDAAAARLMQLPLRSASSVDTPTAPVADPNKIVLWGPGIGQRFNRGDVITAGVVYPVKVPSPLLSILGQATFGSDTIYLKATATAKSEVYFEP